MTVLDTRVSHFFRTKILDMLDFFKLRSFDAEPELCFVVQSFLPVYKYCTFMYAYKRIYIHI